MGRSGINQAKKSLMLVKSSLPLQNLCTDCKICEVACSLIHIARGRGQSTLDTYQN